MFLVKPSFEIIASTPAPLGLLELCGRTCYKSEGKAAEGTAVPFVGSLIRRGHESVIEHASLTVKFIVDRGVTHELVRHRLAAYSQESTRYCNYGKAGHVTFVIPPWLEIEPGEYDCSTDAFGRHGTAGRRWGVAMLAAERTYLDLLDFGWSPQQARSVLPNSLKTEIAMTANLREWRHVFRLRTAAAAHPQMREVMVPLLAECQRLIPVVFDDLA